MGCRLSETCFVSTPTASHQRRGHTRRIRRRPVARSSTTPARTDDSHQMTGLNQRTNRLVHVQRVRDVERRRERCRGTSRSTKVRAQRARPRNGSTLQRRRRRCAASRTTCFRGTRQLGAGAAQPQRAAHGDRQRHQAPAPCSRHQAPPRRRATTWSAASRRSGCRRRGGRTNWMLSFGPAVPPERHAGDARARRSARTVAARTGGRRALRDRRANCR